MFFNTSTQILVLSRKKAGGAVNHWGVQLPDGSVAHYRPDAGVVVTTVDRYADGQDVMVIREVPADRYRDVMERLRLARAHPRHYDALNWNCQSFANWLTGEKAESPEATGWVFVGALALLVGIAARMG